MKLLAIETATVEASVALFVDNVMTSASEKLVNRHSSWVLPTITRLLKAANMSVHDLDGIVFGAGPGSFTGIRVAASIAQGLAMGASLPLYPVCTLGSMVETAKGLDATYAHLPILAVLDARMQQVYWAWNATANCTGVSLSTLDAIPWQQEGPFLVASDLLSMLPKYCLENAVTIYPNALSMLGLVLKGEVSSVLVTDAMPYYVRNQVVFS